MSKTEPDVDGELVEHVEETLGEHRDLLERLADLDTDLSEDAERALQLLDDARNQS